MTIKWDFDGVPSGSAELAAGELNQVKITPVTGCREARVMLSVPIRDIQSYWCGTRGLSLPAGSLKLNIEFVSSATEDFPYFAFFNLKGENRASVGLSELVRNVRCSAKMNQKQRSYDIVFTVYDGEPLEPFTVTADFRAGSWQRCVADWRNSLDLPKPVFPEAAWQPVFCSWYVVHAAFDSTWVEKAAKAAAELGFGTFILDDGWCYDRWKRASPSEVNWYAPLGDWQVSTAKLPDFAAHVKRVQACGIKYMLWVAPFMVGIDSDFYARYRDRLLPDEFNGYRLLDTADPESSGEMLDKLEFLMKEYGLDGLKVDFLDEPTRRSDAPRGHNIMRFVTELSRRIRAANPEAMIEFRQNYATPQMVALGTQFRAVDCPFDYLINFKRCCQIRLSIGDGVPVHADPAYWAEDELPVNIARHMIAMFAGVPMVSIDIDELSESEKKIVSYHLALYRENLPVFQAARWKIGLSLAEVDFAAAVTAEKTIIILNNARALDQALAAASGEVLILNLSAEELPLKHAVCCDCFGDTAPAGVIPTGGSGRIRI